MLAQDPAAHGKLCLHIADDKEQRHGMQQDAPLLPLQAKGKQRVIPEDPVIMHRKHAADHLQRLPETVCPENDPGRHGQEKGARRLDDMLQIRSLLYFGCAVEALPDAVRKLSGNLVKRVEKAPEQEFQGPAVPDPAHGEGQHEVHILEKLPAPVSAQRNVDIVPEPCTQRDMPSSPEVFYGRGKIGMVKVTDHIDPHAPGRPAGHIGAGHEVRVELDAVQSARGQHVHALISGSIREDRIHHDARLVGDHKLQEHSPQDQMEAPHQIFRLEPMRLCELSAQLAVPGDRSLNDVRKERNKERIFKRVLLSRNFPFIDVRQVCDHLKREERRAQRQDQPAPAADERRQRPVFCCFESQKRRRSDKDPRRHDSFAPGAPDQHAKSVTQDDHSQKSAY